MTPTEIVKLGSTFGNVNAYNPSAGAPPGWEVKPLLSKSDSVTGFQATKYYNATTNQYWFAIAGTNDIKDRSAWNSALAGYSGNKAQVDFAVGLMKEVSVGALSQNATVLTSGHSFGGQFTDIGTSVFGWQSVKFDAVGGSSVINSSDFKDKLTELGITPAGGTNAISCNINGFGPFGGSAVGSAGTDIPGTVNCRIDLPSGTASNVVSIALTTLGGLLGWVLGKAITTAFQHDASNIDQAVQSGHFTVNGVVPTQTINFQPYSITDDDGNILRTMQGVDGKPILDSAGKPKLELVVPPSATGAGSTTQFDSTGQITSAAFSVLITSNTITGDQAQPDLFDVLYATSAGDEIDGLEGNDALDGLAGSDKIDGGNGDDLIGGGAGSDNIAGGDGDDWIFSAHSLNVPVRTGPDDVWTAVPPGATVHVQGKTWGIYSDLVSGQPEIHVNYLGAGIADNAPDVIDGGAGDDHVVAGGVADYVDGGLDNDTVHGGGGNDLLRGGDGDDFVWGDGVVAPNSYLTAAPETHGNDYLDGGEGDDQLVGQGGNDAFFGGMGDDTLVGDDINEMLLAGDFHGNDYLDAGEGNDALFGGGGNDQLLGGADDDNLVGDAGRIDLAGAHHGKDFLNGGEGTDVLSGSGNNDVLFGGNGNDQMFGDAGTNPSYTIEGEFHGNDYLEGEGGDDEMYGDGKDDALLGGAGNDVMHGDNLSEFVAGNFHGNDNLDGGDGHDTLFGDGRDDALSGGAGDDELQGDANQNTLAAEFHGNDSLDGGDGNDRLFGQGGDDTLSGGTGDDLLKGDSSEANVVGLYHGSDNLDGGEGADTLEGGGGNDILNGGAGNDILQGDAALLDLGFVWHGNDVLDGGDGNDLLYGAGGNDTLNGGAGDDNLQGEDGDDSLSGGTGNDILNAGAGTNVLDGGDGNDNLGGGAGNDTLVGGSGNDVIYRNGGLDTIDGGTGDDTIRAYGTGGATIFFGRGSGRDYLSFDTFNTAQSYIRFKEGVGAADLQAYRGGANTLVLGIVGTSDFIYIEGYSFPDRPLPGIQATPIIQLSDGSVWVPPTAGMGNFGNVGSVIVTANADLLVAGTGVRNTVRAGGGDDTLLTSAFTYTGQTNYYGEDGNDNLIGGIGTDYMLGGTGDDLLDGGGGAADTLFGESGSNTYVFAKGYGSNTRINAQRPTGTNAVQTLSLVGLLPSDIELRRIGFSDWLEVKVVGTSDSLRINSFFAPSGLGGLDFAIDQFKFENGVVWDFTSIIAHVFSQDQDQVLYAIGDEYNAPAGGAGNDTIYGTDFNNFLDGGYGNDTMYGKNGTDSYIVRDNGDVVIELADEGVDSVTSLISYTLPANVENLSLLGVVVVQNEILNTTTYFPANINGTGNELNNQIAGDYGDNILDGRAGADEMYGNFGSDTYIVDNYGDYIGENANEGTDTVISSVSRTLEDNVETLILSGTTNLNGTGNALDNVLTGNSGNNTLNGVTGNDTLKGGAGNDSYTVGDAAAVVVELAGEGIDTVNASITYELGANVEKLTLTGSALINATGNDSDNTLIGNSASNTLIGNAGNDILDGKDGFDNLLGGLGDDTYIISAQMFGTDSIAELVNEGVDTVQSSIEYSLGENLENLTLSGTTAINGTANSQDNTLTGNGAANILTGGSGNDTYVVGAGDTTVELAGEGIDTVQSAIAWTLAAEVENLTLTGTSAVAGTGNGLANVLTGNSAANTLSGAAGDDQYRFNLGGGADRIIETSGNDRIVFGAGITSAQITASRTGSVVKLMVNGTDSVSIDDLGGGLFAVEQFEFANGSVLGAAWLNGLIPSAAPTATNLSAVETYTEDTAKNLVDIVVTDTDSANTTVSLTLSSAAAGSLNVGTSGTVTSTFNQGTGVWLASGVKANVNTLLAALTFMPTANFNGNFTIVTSVTDGSSTPIVGSKAFTGTAVNDVPTGAVTITGIAAQGQTLTAANTLADVDGLGTISYQWKAAGVAISGATNSAWLLAAAQLGKIITVSASYTDGKGRAESVTSAATAAVTAAPIVGTTGADTLNGTTGADQMVGLAGNDTYVANNAGDIIVENLNEGTDLVNASVSYTLATNLENITLTGTTAINATGNGLDNTLTGNSAINILTGGAGNDLYVVGTGDTTIEAAGAGTDTVQSSLTRTLAANVENLILTGTSAVNGTGNLLDNTLTGNSAANVLTGGAGNDLYIVGTGDTTIEAASAGTDVVQSAIAWTLAANVENLSLTGSAAVNGTGNADANVLVGNTGANTLTGNAGADTLRGLAGADILTGSTGNDTYWLARGYGADSITENDTTAGNTDLARFETGIAADQLWFRQVSNNLEVSIIGTTDKFTLNNWYLGNQYHVEQFKTSDGKTLLDSQVQNLVSAMAAFAPPAAGQTTLSATYSTALTPVIAANWI